MIQKIKSIKKTTLILIVLFAINLALFSLVSQNIKHNYPTTDTISTVNDANTYFKAGVNVLDWSYTLLRYFNK